MLRTMKRAMVAGAVVAVGAMAGPAMGSAAVWSQTGGAHLSGLLTSVMPATGITSTCDVTAVVDLSNDGGVAGGTVTEFLWGTNVGPSDTLPDGGSCSTNLPNCDQSIVSGSLPWSISTAGSSVTFAGVDYTTTYGSDGSCPINGQVRRAAGSFTGAASSNVFSFLNAPGLSMALGGNLVALMVNGSLEIYAENQNGDPDYEAPIVLQ